MDNTLKHAGTKGMRWGVRRYQNPDGTLTEAGKKRYGRDAREKGYSDQDEQGNYYKPGKKGKKNTLEVDSDRWQTEDWQRTKRVAEETERTLNKAQQITDRSIQNDKKNKVRLDLSNMTEKEMRDKINRELIERQYNDLFAPKNESKGKEVLSKIFEGAAATVGLVGGALGIAVAIKELVKP